MGVVYLETNSYEGAFVPERLRILAALVAQLAISIENARLVERLTRQSDELQRKNTELERAVRLKDNFSPSPATSCGRLSMAFWALPHLLAETALDEVQRDYLRVVESSSRSLLRLVNDLLDVCRLRGTASRSSSLAER